MMESRGYLRKLLPPVQWDYQEVKIREDVEQGHATEDERAVVIGELERANWPHDLAVKMTRETHPLSHDTDR
jgi:hypothetical protein